MGASVHVRGLTKSFGRRNVWQDVTLSLPPGEITALLGPSGTGKSVFLKSVMGLIRPEAGECLVDGVDMVSASKAERQRVRSTFGVLFQDGALFGSQTIFDNVAFPLREHTTMSERQISARVNEKLEMVGLVGSERLLPGEVSGGMRKRAGLARSLVREPELILCDEPDSGLDPVRTAFLAQLIVDVNAATDATVLVVTHNIDLARTLPDNIGMLYRRELVAFGPREDVLRLEDPVVTQFLGGIRQGPIGMSEETDHSYAEVTPAVVPADRRAAVGAPDAATLLLAPPVGAPADDPTVARAPGEGGAHRAPVAAGAAAAIALAPLPEQVQTSPGIPPRPSVQRHRDRVASAEPGSLLAVSHIDDRPMPPMPTRPIAPVRGLNKVGEVYALGLDVVRLAFRPPWRLRETVEQFWFLASVSILPAALISIPFGAVIALQLGTLTVQIGAQSFTGAASVLAVIQQASPIVTALVIAGAGGAAICADLGSRTIREEIDAMAVLGVDPVERLVVPRVVASVLVAMLLNGLVSVVGVAGGYFFNVVIQGGTPGAYLSSFTALAQIQDLYVGEIKAAIFGFLAGLIAAYRGLNPGPGPKGVGDAVNQSVVTTFLLLFMVNFLITTLYLQIVPGRGA